MFHDDEGNRHVARWRTSGMSRAAYCREHGLPYQPFLTWTKRSAIATTSLATASGFIEMRRPSSAMAERGPSGGVTLGLPCGLTLRADQGTDANWIGQLVAAVRRC